MWETRHCHVIVETFPATKRERGALRQRERRELTNGGGNGTGGRPVRTGSLRLAVREHGRPRERARYGNSSEHARLRERERERPRERQATVVETGSEPRTKGVGRPYL